VSDLPRPVQSVRTTLSINALLAVAILLIVAFSGGGTTEAFVVAALYFAVVGGWTIFRAWRAGRAMQGGDRSTKDRTG
jgi:uncharacterized membrane protein (DUF4010 family)